ncbi:MAG: triose-phosphate isomerase [Thermoplasmata archaeon]|nr:triose-phosphate isomerase [Thermoplasmata archaeon]NIS12479.1 triose-phosphate isomerase [Thermoplasmata archaeon]NIS20398.1 triose-phosphate isomerase [Thermoplasmata archaeon]NIT77744.1 triose-phosphate isomerase [Thermoplasmata archaeon]NIU49485.1 triose-phosphate isomerase [Thermoplasmata archaeon]
MLIRLRTPIIIVNLKTYDRTRGEGALRVARQLDKVASETGVAFAVAPNAFDVRLLAAETSLPMLAQSVDAVPEGSHTGHLTPEAAKDAGAVGSLVNHSEHRLRLADIEHVVDRLRGCDMDSVVCTNNAAVSRAAAAVHPTFVAVEPPELIGGDVSVTTADPGVVSSSVDLVRSVAPDVRVLCGAGVKTGTDVEMAIDLGTDGVLLASGVALADDVASVARDLAAGVR